MKTLQLDYACGWARSLQPRGLESNKFTAGLAGCRCMNMDLNESTSALSTTLISIFSHLACMWTWTEKKKKSAQELRPVLYFLYQQNCTCAHKYCYILENDWSRYVEQRCWKINMWPRDRRPLCSCCATVWQLSVLKPPPAKGPAARLVLIYGIGMEPLPAHLFPGAHC